VEALLLAMMAAGAASTTMVMFLKQKVTSNIEINH
jgi:hypothetical protein